MRELIDLLREAEENTQEPVYASKQQIATVGNSLNAVFPSDDPKNPMVQLGPAKHGRVPHLRFSNLTMAQIDQAMQSLGLVKDANITPLQLSSSGQFDIASYVDQAGVKYTLVIRGAKASKGKSGDLILNRKDLTPVKLGLAGQFSNRKDLIDATKNALDKHFSRDPKLAESLKGLVDLAAERGVGQLAPELLAHIQDRLGMISQDFGEILAPIVLADDTEDITFPAGNEKLIDVTIGDQARYSVKALSGSGTSMMSLGNLLDQYEASLTDQGTRDLFTKGVKIWKSTRKEGSVTDRICLAAKMNQTPEYLSYVDILGGEFETFSELKKLLKPKVDNLDYADFLRMILPATQAGHWGINVGMPADSEYYLGNTQKTPKPGTAGRNSYNADHVDGAANIITYCIGQGFKKMITEGPDAARYKEIVSDMVRQLNCRLGHVTIDTAGQLIITSKPFSELEFGFDYHAPSNMAGNNRPGFLIIPPNAGDKGKKSKKSKTDTDDSGPKTKLKDPGASMSADAITRPGREATPRSIEPDRRARRT